MGIELDGDFNKYKIDYEPRVVLNCSRLLFIGSVGEKERMVEHSILHLSLYVALSGKCSATKGIKHYA